MDPECRELGRGRRWTWGRRIAPGRGLSIETKESTDGGQQLLLGKMLLERGLITAEQLREALADRAQGMRQGTARPLGVILVAKGFLSDTQLVQLLAEQAHRPPSSSSGGIPSFAPPPPLPPSSVVATGFRKIRLRSSTSSQARR